MPRYQMLTWRHARIRGRRCGSEGLAWIHRFAHFLQPDDAMTATPQVVCAQTPTTGKRAESAWLCADWCCAVPGCG